MQLRISNVGKIEKATIDIDGITVIAGENDAGKSTIGKTLFAIFNSMNNMDEKIAQERKNKIYVIIRMLLQGRLLQKTNNFAERMQNINGFARRLSVGIMECSNDYRLGNIEDFLRSQINKSTVFENKVELEEFIKECSSRVEQLLSIPDEKVMTEVITRWFNRVFEKQMSPLRDGGIDSNIEMVIKDKKITYLFKEDACVNWNSEINILHQAFYIDNPFVIDEMSDHFNVKKITESHLLKYLCNNDGDIFDGIFDAVIAKDKLNEIYSILGEVIEGDIEENQDGEYWFKSSKYAKPLNVKNLSTGMKSFALIKKLLENGSIKEKDVLILDEPEIHLHPEWQLLYAKLIVLLQKEFDLSMIITTHSPYFLDAIDVFSAKYGTSHRTRFYLAENHGDLSSLHDATDNIDIIYEKLSDPMQMLENLRYNG
ncbi:MAG: AAA family ATPase [Eubacteriales bacterium]|nr:AAA family ATPase [Eubacteriales bacterium]